ncbi:MAG: hypothetical protein JWL87_501 [Candidatus Adlerbacteria bacterium]|nr:hypothetical protein [Candidatus Adlerbacteria bacterium]
METLLMVFIGLVAVALMIIAAGIGAVAWYLVLLLRELNAITRRLHEAGEAAAGDLAELRETIRAGSSRLGSIWDILLGLAAARFNPPARKKPRVSRVRVEDMRGMGGSEE